MFVFTGLSVMVSECVDEYPPPGAPPAVAARDLRFQREIKRTIKGLTETELYFLIVYSVVQLYTQS
jgi:hypothetical protein